MQAGDLISLLSFLESSLKTCLIVHHRKVGKTSLKCFFFSDLAHVLILSYAQNPVGIILRKLGTSASGTSCILQNGREPTTMALHLNVVFNIKLW
jgi:hypothetical protein